MTKEDDEVRAPSPHQPAGLSAEQVAQNRRDSAPVLADLRRLGFDVAVVSELFNRRICYEDAIPVLLHWLPRIENEYVKEAIVRALTVKWAKPFAAPALIKEFTRAHRFALKWAIGNALEVVVDDSVFADIVRLILDREHGRSREMLVAALGNMKDARALELAITLLGDDALAGYAAIAVGKLKDPRARSHLIPLLEHTDPWIRDRAKRAIKGIDRAEERRIAREVERAQRDAVTQVH
jgi:hypothetical protein